MTQRAPIHTAISKAGVVWFGIMVLGIGFGVLAVDNGFPWWAAPLISLTVLAGSMEFILIGLIAAGAPLLSIAVATLLINFRHLFYGLTYPLEAFKKPWQRLYIVFCMVDEAFAVVMGLPREERDPKVMWWIHVGLHLSWAGGSLIGAVFGARLLGGLAGLDFVLIALFVVLAMDSWHVNKDAVGLLLALGAAGVGAMFGHQQMMLIAMTLFAVALVIRHKVVGRHE
ncbi:AzlC family ABC transporter permease [Corynebacterium sp. H127]|uniref:AzlC family ABC transporter permease n=1 Tax=Corynebacterium sp. H127 TaxID=3133418 RepID=UPI0030B5C877